MRCLQTCCRRIKSSWSSHIAAFDPADRCPIVTQAIAEFFTDSAVFASMHPDMPDLQLPAWAAGASDFIRRHRCPPQRVALSGNAMLSIRVKQLDHCTGTPL